MNPAINVTLYKENFVKPILPPEGLQVVDPNKAFKLYGC